MSFPAPTRAKARPRRQQRSNGAHSAQVERKWPRNTKRGIRMEMNLPLFKDTNLENQEAEEGGQSDHQNT